MTPLQTTRLIRVMIADEVLTRMDMYDRARDMPIFRLQAFTPCQGTSYIESSRYSIACSLPSPIPLPRYHIYNHLKSLILQHSITLRFL